MSSDALVHLCKSLLNTLGRAVEQVAGATQASKSQQSRSKYKSHSAQGYEYLIFIKLRMFQSPGLESRLLQRPQRQRGAAEQESWIFLPGPR